MSTNQLGTGGGGGSRRCSDRPHPFLQHCPVFLTNLEGKVGKVGRVGKVGKVDKEGRLRE
jgi:hypothetical protein